VWKLFLSGNRNGDTAENKQPPAPTENSQSKSSTATATASEKKSTPAVVNPNIARLITGLKDADVEERRRAARALQSLGAEAEEATAALTEALKDSDEEVQMLAAFTLVNNKSYDKRTIPILIRSLRHENATLRQVACLSLAIIPYESAEKEAVIPALAAATANDDSEEVRKAAYSALTIIAPDIVAKANEK
jgi:HEAT repeat protein